MTPFIDDGLTMAAYISAMPGVHPELRFEYRPMLVSERSLMARAWEQRAGSTSEVTAEHLARKIVRWQLEDRPTAENLLRLRARLFDRLLSIITGQEASDVDPRGDVDAPFDQQAVAKN